MKFPRFLLILLLPLIASCTRNNGDVGQWFGQWHVVDISCNGRTVDGFEPVYFLNFQNKVLSIIRLEEDVAYTEINGRWGTWEETSPTTLQFDFTHTDDDESGFYSPFPVFHFPADHPFTLTVTKQGSGKVTLSFTHPDDGKEYSYSLQKY